MVVRRDSRRRRLVMDQQAQPLSGQTQAAPATGSRESTSDMPRESATERRLYGFGATRRGQPKTTDLLPKRRGSFALVVALLVFVMAGLNLLAHYSTGWQGSIGTEGWELLQLNGPGTLAGWFCSLVLILSGFAAWQIFSIQKHRRDDYHGRYRFWAWAGAVLILASVNCVADMGVLISNVAASSGYVQSEATVWILLSAKLLILAMILVRGLYAVRGSWGAVTTAVVAWASFSLAAGMQIPEVSQSLPFDYQVSHGNLIIVGCVALFLTQLTFGRFVFLQAEGLILGVEKTSQALEEIGQDTVTQPIESTATQPIESTATVTPKKVQTSKASDAAAQLKALVAESESSQKSDQEDRVEKKTPVKDKSLLTRQTAGESNKSKRKKKKASQRSEAEQDVAATLQMMGGNDGFEADESEPAATIKMSKAERRRQRKAARNQRRAA